MEERWSLAAAAEAAGVSVVTARKWVRRAAAGESLEDRSSAPRRLPSSTPQGLVDAIAALRRLRMTAVEIAELLGMALATVSLWLKRIGLGKRSRLEPPEPPIVMSARGRASWCMSTSSSSAASARAAPATASSATAAARGQLTATRKHLRRDHGFEYVHVMVDDYSRLAFAEVLDALDADVAIGFLRRALKPASQNAASGSSE